MGRGGTGPRGGFPVNRMQRPAARPDWRRSLRSLPARAGLVLGAIVVVGAGLVLVFAGAILNGYGRRRVERAFDRAHPGFALRIGDLQYSVGANRLVARAVILDSPSATLKAGRLSLSGVRWVRLLWGAAPVDVLAGAGLDATGVAAEFPRAGYAVACARLRASVPDSELIVEKAELRALVGDELFFAAHDFRTTRYHVVVPGCRVTGLGFDDLLRGGPCRIRSIRIFRPSLDALVDRDKPVKPFVARPLMVHDALAAIPRPLQVDSLSLTDGHLAYREQVVAGADPGVVTIGNVNAFVENLTNRGDAASVIRIRAQGDLMDSGTIKLLMAIPVASPDFSFHYSGSLGAMDLTRLDAFLEIAEHIRVKSGNANAATFEIDVKAGQASGRVRASYANFEMAVLDKQTGSATGLDDRVESFLANKLKFRSSNAPDAAGVMKEGKVDYARKPGDTFLQFVWFALRSGALDAISQ